MLRNFNHIRNTLKHFEFVIQTMLRKDPFPRDFAVVGSLDTPSYSPRAALNLRDIIGDGFLLAVPKFRRSIEKRWKRKFGHPDFFWKPLVPKTNIRVCVKCGHHHESGILCANCLVKVEEETKAMQEKIQEALGNEPIEQDVVVLYEGEKLEKPPEEWNGKRIVEMKKQRPSWFSKNLLQKTTQQPSDSTDVKPTELA